MFILVYGCYGSGNIHSKLLSGHVFAFGESRALAIANMVLGLKEIQIRGEIRTNVDYTIDLLHVRFSDSVHFIVLTEFDT